MSRFVIIAALLGIVAAFIAGGVTARTGAVGIRARTRPVADASLAEPNRSTPSVAACAVSQLRFVGEFQGAVGNSIGGVSVTNVGRRRCALDGYARVAVWVNGHRYPQRERDQHGAGPFGPAPRAKIVLAPVVSGPAPGERQHAAFLIDISDYCGPGALVGHGRLIADQVRVAVPRGRATRPVRITGKDDPLLASGCASATPGTPVLITVYPFTGSA